METLPQSVSILGTRGIPARHGGFETFAEKLALYLVKRGWDVTVYCQVTGEGEVQEEEWQGVRLVKIPVIRDDALHTIIFDWRAIRQATRKPGCILTLGYNTAFLSLYCLLRRKKQIINMDGIEWKRKKWSLPVKIWFYLNEKLGALMGNALVADHPEIKNHLTSVFTRKKITMIPYGADYISHADKSLIDVYKLEEKKYALLIARPEPENSILEVVKAFSETHRGIKLVVLGGYDEAHPYQKQVMEAASVEVMFVGAIYDKEIVSALRYYARFYIHGHQVGGTNPALVEALGASCAVLAHKNKFNTWVAGKAAIFFSDVSKCSEKIKKLIEDQDLLNELKTHSENIHRSRFTWKSILGQYESLLIKYNHRCGWSGDGRYGKDKSKV